MAAAGGPELQVAADTPERPTLGKVGQSTRLKRLRSRYLGGARAAEEEYEAAGPPNFRRSFGRGGFRVEGRN